MKDLSRKLPTFQLRRIAACNLLKHFCLEEKHVPGDDQYDQMFEHFSRVGSFGEIPDQRTWKTWLVGTSMIKDSRLAFLDAVCEKTIGRKGVIKSLVYAWPIGHADRARNSPIHLHFDALDAVGFWGGKDDKTWAEEKRTRAEAIFCTLQSEWNPTSGFIYRTFKSDLGLKLELASDQEREEIRSSYKQWDPNLLVYNRLLTTPPKPNSDLRDLYENVASASVLKYLIGMAIDKDFLVHDRFDRWAIDFATASAAWYASAYSNRYDTFGSVQVTNEKRIVAGTNELFWVKETDFPTVLWQFGESINIEQNEMLQQELCRLWEARELYWNLMNSLGISLPQIENIMHHQWEARPIVIS